MRFAAATTFTLLFAAGECAGQPPGPPAEPVWATRLADGTAQARRRGQPVFVRVGSASCPWCRKLEAELRDPAVAKELDRWALVALDVTGAEKDARALAVGPVPALRVLTASGRVVASRDGFLPTAELVEWLGKHHAAAAAPPAEELTAAGAPDAAAVGRLVEELNQRDPALREAAVRRLLPNPKLAAAPVVGAFTKGSLQPRLAALELLREWQAPVKDIDPWQPGTLTAPRLEALSKWAADPPAAAPPAARELTAEEQKAVRADFARLVAAPDAEAIRDRLARHGPALLVEVYAALKHATTDAACERLTALRYRVAASDAIALRCPGGLERLASTTAATRHEAVQELARRATAADEPLLLELFGSPDPLVREIGLRTLHAVAGRAATGALAWLLQDPDPNVRAAVLKQLSDTPSPQVVTAIAAYLATETDPDLVVHAVRVLRAAGQGDGGRSVVEHLLPQFRHANWRVRTEAVEAVGEYLSNSRSFDNRSPDDGKEAARAAVRGALADADGFVVGRAVGVLKKSGQPSDIEPLVKAAADHPELVAEVVAALSYGGDRSKASLPHLRAFCLHRDPAVRSRAIPAVCAAAPDEAAAELKAGLTDPAAQVREATAAQMFDTLTVRRQNLMQSGGPRRPGEGTPNLDALTAELRGGKGRPEGFGEMVPLLEGMLKAGEPAERAEAALALVALDRAAGAAPVLAAAAAADGHVIGRAARALAWLPWEQRFDLFRRLRALRLDDGAEEALVRWFTEVPDARAVAPLWEMAARDPVPGAVAGEIAGSLVAVTSGIRYRSSSDPVSPALLKLGEEAKEKSRAGPEAQRLVALVVLVSVDAAAAAEAAKAVFDDATAPAALRRDAFQILLLCGRQGATTTAVTGLASGNPDLRRLSVLYLSVGESAVHYLRERHVYLNSNSVFNFSDFGGGHARYVPRVPPGLGRAVLRALLRDADAPTAAGAGYLLALLGDPDGLPPLLRHWRENARDDRVWTSLLVTAVSCLDDDALVPVIEEAYRVLAPAGRDRRDPGATRDWSTIRDLYWTMRPMGGPNALRLRKTIRAEIVMRALGDPDRGGSFP